MMKGFEVGRSSRPVPLILFMNFRLYHGGVLLDSSANLVVPFKNDNEFAETFVSFKKFTVDKLPLESQVAFEVSALYNNSFLKKLGIITFSIFD